MAIVTELLGEEKCVGDIEGRLKARQANISQHLSVLRWAGIVDFRTEGKNRCYYLKDPKKYGNSLPGSQAGKNMRGENE